MEETRSDCAFTEDELRLVANDLGLSRREGDVLILALQNVKREAMGPKLAISRGSVNTYSARLHRKMNVNCRTELMKRVVEALLKRRGGGDPFDQSIRILFVIQMYDL